MSEITLGDWKTVSRCDCKAMWSTGGISLLQTHLNEVQPFCPKCGSRKSNRLTHFKAQLRTEIAASKKHFFRPWTWFAESTKTSYWVTKDGEILR